MIKPVFYPNLPKTNYEYQDGESIEIKVKRITENNEPIKDGAQIIYTNREDGVLPAYNIYCLSLYSLSNFRLLTITSLHNTFALTNSYNYEEFFRQNGINHRRSLWYR